MTGEAYSRCLNTAVHSHCAAARAAWVHCTQRLVQWSRLGLRLEEIARCADVSCLHSAHARMQTIVSRALAECRFVELRESCSSLDGINKVAEQTRLTSCSHRGSTAFLRAFPTGPNARIANVEMRVCMQIYLGTIVPILAAAPAQCHCWRRGATGPALADLRGHHDTVCRSNSMLARHNAPLEALSLALRLLGIGTSRTSRRPVTVGDGGEAR